MKSDWGDAPKKFREEREREEKLAAPRHEPSSPRPKEYEPPEWVDGSNWDDEPIPEQEWTLEGKIPRRQVCLFSGEGAAGKSTIGLHLCVAHVLGRDCLKAIASPGPAFFIDAEDELGVIRRRLNAVREHYDVRFSDILFDGGLHIMSLAGKDPLMATVGRGGVILPTKLYDHVLAQAIKLRPQTIVIASSANVYAGSEIDRPSVTQFINMLTRLAIAANGSVVLVSHPSLQGIHSLSGISGSTQWHNAVRARLLIRTLKSEDQQKDEGLRLVECKKNQYGPPSDAFTMEWKNGMFLPTGGPDMFQRAAQEARAQDAFREYLTKFGQQGRNVSADPSAKNYAPTMFSKASGVAKKDLEDAMQTLFDGDHIKVDTYGPPSRPHSRVVFND